MENDIISLREFARRMSIGEKTIRDAIKLGKIVDGVTQINGKPKIIYDIAYKEFKEINLGAQVLGESDYKDVSAEEMLSEGVAGLSGNTSLATATRAEKIFKAQKAFLEVERLKGTLVEREEVYRQLFQVATEIRSSILAIPDKITDDLIAISDDRNSFYKLLVDTINNELTVLSDMKDRDILKSDKL